MAVNQVAYFVNPASANNKIVGETTTGAGSTIYTVPGGVNMRVKCFTITLKIVSGGVETDYVSTTLKIGTGRYTVALKPDSAHAAGEASYLAVSSADLGFEPSFLQPADTITTTITSVVAGGMTYVSSVSITVEDFTA